MVDGTAVDGELSSARDARVRASVRASMAGKAAELVSLVLLGTLVPRVLGPDAYGRFAVPLSIVTLGSLALTLGGPTVLGRFVPLAPEAERLALARAIGARLARGRLLQVAGVAIVALVASALDPGSFPRLVTGLVVAALALSVLTTLALQVALGLGRSGPWSARYPIQNAVLITGVLALHRSWSGTGAVVAIVLSTLAAAAFAGVVVAPHLRGRVAAVALPEGALGYGARHATGAALTQVAQRGGVVAVALLGASTQETGFAALALGLALGATYAVLQAFTVSLPHLADASPGDTRRAEAALRRLATPLLAVLVAGAAAGALVLPEAVPAVFGDDYRGAIDAFGPALGLVVLAPLGSLLTQATALRLRGEVAVASGIASLAGFVVVALVAVPRWGALGATSAVVAGEAASSLTALRLLPGAAGRRLTVGSFAGAAAVVALAVVR